MPTLNIQCPHCKAPLKIGFNPPPLNVHNIVCRWADDVLTTKVPNAAKLMDSGALLLQLYANDKRHTLSIEMGDSVEVPTKDGKTETKTWELRKLGPGVVQLSPSIVHGNLHAFITITNWPEGKKI